MNYRISVTALEKFRRMIENVSDYDTEASLVETLEGKFKGTIKTSIGTAFHRLIELPFSPTHGCTIENISFSPEQANKAILYRNTMVYMIHEVSANKIYHTKHMDFHVSGRADGIWGNQIRDAKLKFSLPAWGEYFNSCQWKFYLDMFDADIFFYDVFEVRNFKEIPNSNAFEGDIIEHDPFHCLRYNKLSEDIHFILELFAQFIHDRNYYHLLKSY